MQINKILLNDSIEAITLCMNMSKLYARYVNENCCVIYYIEFIHLAV